MSGGVPAFAPTVDAAAYVPHAGAERVLASLEEWACDAERPVRLLRGPEGSGKSMLLAVIAARVGRHATPVPLSAPGLDPETLARRVLDALGTPWEGTPRVALARAVEQLGGRRVLLLIDDADALTPRTEMWLFDFVRRSAGALHALLAVRDERLAADLANAFETGTEVLAIDATMSREEAEAWVRAELARSGAGDDLRARFDAATLTRLHTRSGGVPGRVRKEAAAIVAEASARAAELVASRPLEEVAPSEAPLLRLPAGSAVPADRSGPTLAQGRNAVAAPVPPRPPPPRRPAPREVAAPDGGLPEITTHEVGARASAVREPRQALPRELAPARTTPPPREASAPRAAAAAARSAAPAAGASTRSGVDPQAAFPNDAGRRDSLLRWLVVPAALAAAYVAGFLTSQTVEVLRSSPAPAEVAVEAREESLPPVAAPPPREREGAAPVAEMRAHDPFTPPPLPDAPAADAPRADAAAPAEPVTTATGSPAPAPPSGAAAPAVSAPPPALAPDSGVAGAEASAPAAAEAAEGAAAEPSAPARRTATAPRRNVRVNVEAEPGASILVDGRPVGSGSVQGLQLSPGPHRVEVWLPDGRVVERVVEVRGTRYNVNVR